MTINKRQIEKLKDCCAVFAAGAVVYTGAELLWRGHSHWTMTLTGVACTLFIHLANRRMRPRGVPMAVRCLAGCGIITGAEFAVGLIVNRLLGWGVWDYSDVPFNILGQICPLYCIMWFILSFPAICISNWLDCRGRRALVFGS